VFAGNVLAGPFPVNPIEPLYDHYPGNSFPPDLGAVGFIDLANRDYRLSSSSPYKGAATDGSDIGADVNLLQSAFAAVTSAPH